MQVGSDEVTEKSPKANKRYIRARGQLVKGPGEWSSNLSVSGKNTDRNRKTHMINMCSEAGAISGILVFSIMGRFTWHQAFWQQMESSSLNGGKGLSQEMVRFSRVEGVM